MATSSDIRKGLCIKYSNDIYKVIEFLHVKPGKGPPFVRTKHKSVTNGKMEVKMNTEESWDEIVELSYGVEYLKNICQFSKLNNNLE